MAISLEPTVNGLVGRDLACNFSGRLLPLWGSPLPTSRPTKNRNGQRGAKTSQAKGARAGTHGVACVGKRLKPGI